MAGVLLEQVTKVFPNGVRAVDAVDLEIGDGEFMVLVGPSGCGKTTLLRMIAGLEEVSFGRISIGGRDVTMLAPRRRDIAMVFQNYALYPHMTVGQNLGFGLRLQKVSKDERRRRVEEVAGILGLDTLLERKPAALSGGQRQRVAMGRAMVREPQVYLMDEPLSNLDAKLRVGMRASLAELHARLGVTTIYVTHDQTEAMTLGQRVAVLREGRIVQVDAPQTLYAKPRNVFVAAFIGSPSMNLVEAVVDADVVRFGGYAVPLDPERRPPTGPVVLGIRPEAFEDAAFADPRLPRLDVHVDVLEQLGADTHACFRVQARAPQLDLGIEGDEVSLLTQETTLFTARLDPRSEAHQRSALALAVDPAAFHFFDVHDGSALAADPTPAAGAEQVPVGSAENWS